MNIRSIWDFIIIASWLVFAIYWLISASKAKTDAGPQQWWRGRLFSFLRLALIIVLSYLYPSIVRQGLYSAPATDRVLAVAGTLLAVGGIALALWARRYLGTNWSLHPARKENHELVTSGPYRILRHPIYTGMLAGLFGSLLVYLNAFWFYFFVIMGVTILYRVPTEEKLMMQTFPNAYAAYKKRTKALIPFVW